VKLEMKKELRKVDEEISYYIRPATFPVAVKMLEAGDIGAANGKRPKRDLGLDILLCQAIGICRRQGWSILLTQEDIQCPSALFYLGFAKPPEAYWQGKIAFAPFNQTEKARARRSKSFPFFPLNKYKGLLISPLFKAEFKPDVLLIYGRPAQMMRFVQAAVFRRGDALKFTAQGGGSCASEVVDPILRNRVRLVLPGNGERIFGLIQDDEMVFAIPGRKIQEIVADLRETHKGGQRFPVPAYGAYTPQMPADYAQLLRAVRKEE
jgi:uncharacterized protein (DUF169 family)